MPQSSSAASSPSRSASIRRLRWWRLAGGATAIALAAWALAGADPYPPYWGGGTAPAVHFAPVAWPETSDWRAYTYSGVATADQRVGDPSNGGTSPQGYVNVSSGCTDQTEPSTYYAFRNGVLFFRWRVQQAPNTYATGPSAGSFSSSSPWSSALWTVLIDVTGDGYRDFAVQLDGSSGSPSAAVDRLTSVYSRTRSQSVDYLGDPANVKLLAHSPTAFVDQASGRILNFQGALAPTPLWPNGSAETRWDYGTTRTTLLPTGCGEYFIDYQLPLAMLDATAHGGPAVTATTPMSLAFATSNSLQNPLQKDVVFAGDYVADGIAPVPFGDVVTAAGGIVTAPVVTEIAAAGCGPTTLSATVRDTVTPAGTTTVTSVQFFTYRDVDADGTADDGSTWTAVPAAAATTNAPVGRWTASWDASVLPSGHYLIGVRAEDAQGHVTFSHLAQADLPSADPGKTNHANPDAIGPVVGVLENACGVLQPAAGLEISVDRLRFAVGEAGTFTLTVTNNGGAAMTVDSVTSVLPSGFAFASTSGGSLAPPAGSVSGQAVTWTFGPAATIGPASSGTLVFTATATAAGVSSTTASAQTSGGALLAAPVEVTVASPALGLVVAADVASAANGAPVVLTTTVTNGSTAAATGTVVTLPLPVGLDHASHVAPPGTSATYDGGTRTVTWTIGTFPGRASLGDPEVTASLQVDTTVSATAGLLLATATLDSDQTLPQSAHTSVGVTQAGAPSFTIQAGAATATLAPGGSTTASVTYANTGDTPATTTVVTLPVPTGFTASGIGGGGAVVGSTITWNLGDVPAGGGATLGFTLTAATPFTGSTPSTFTASVVSTETGAVSDSFSLGITLPGDLCQTFYFKEAVAENVGVDGMQTHLARTGQPSAGTTGSSVLLADVGTTYVEAVSFYQSPANGSDTVFSGNLTSTLYLDRNPGITIWAKGEVFDYDPATGARQSLGWAEGSYGGNTTGPFTFPVALSGTLQAGHRLLWVYSVRTANNTRDVLLQFGGTVANSVSGNTPATYAPASGSFCTTRPALPTLDTQASPAVVSPSDALTYTVRFGNAGQTAMQHTDLVFTLPADVTFGNATLNGAPVSPTGNVGQQYTFRVHSSDSAPTGQVNAGATGTLVISTTIGAGATPGATLTATSALSSDQTSTITDSRAVNVQEAAGPPAITLLKSADKAIVEPASVNVAAPDPAATVTYTITVANTGTGPATSVVVTDVLPATGEFAYVAGSAELGAFAVTPEPYNAGSKTLTVNVGTVPAGTTATVRFRMTLGPGGAAAGTTSFANTASVAFDGAGGPGTTSSGAATVAVRSTSALQVTLTSSPPDGATVAPGDEITYTAVVTSVGTSPAVAPRVTVSLPADPISGIPAPAGYVAGSLVVDGATRTDAADGDQARADVAAREVVFDFADMAPGASHTVRFKARVAPALPAGTTTLGSTARASSPNAPTAVSPQVILSAAAAPNLSVTVTAPGAVPFPAARLAADVSNATTFTVATGAGLAAGQVVAVNGAFVTITSVDGTTVTVNAPVSGASGDHLVATLEYLVEYANTGTADANNVEVSVPIPAGTTFVSASNGVTPSGGTLAWALGVVGAGDGGVLRFRVVPAAPGTFTATAQVASDETSPASSGPATAVAGAVTLAKRTLTPAGTVVDGVMTATFEITATNQHPTVAAAGLVVTDRLPAGFRYRSTTSVTGATASTSPTVGDEQPAWNFASLPGGGVITITFVAEVGNVAAGLAHNDVVGTSTDPGVAVLPYDGTSSTAEDVTFVAPLGTTGTLATPATLFETAGSLTVTVTDIDLDVDPGVPDTIAVTVVNRRTGETETLTLTETGPATGVFSAPLPVTKSATKGTDGDGTLNVLNGDTVRVTVVDQLTSVPGPVTLQSDTAVVAAGGEPPPAPTVTSLAPASGAAAGGVTVLISGTRLSTLSGPVTVTFGGVPATGVVVVDDGTISVVSPALPAGTPVDVVVRNDGAEVGTLAQAYTPLAPPQPPTVTSLAPASGAAAGGVTVLISGTRLGTLAGPVTVTFGGVPATGVVVVDDTTISVVTPALPAGTPVDVVVRNGGAVVGTLPSAYTPLATGPTLVSLSPATGLASGGVAVVLSGTGFGTLAGPVLVTFGGVAAHEVRVLSDTEIRVITPPLPAGSPVEVALLDGATRVGTLPYLPVADPTDDVVDTDDDGLPDEWELRYGFDPLQPGDDARDPDGDGKTNLEEYQRTTHPRGSYTRYFAEGVSNRSLSTRLALFNPSVERTVAVVRFLRSVGPELVREVELPGLSRAVVEAGTLPGLEDAEFGLEIVSGTLVGAEETVSWDATQYGSHAERAVEASPTWYFGEGATIAPFDLFYLVLNPGNVPAQVRVKYLQSLPDPPVEQVLEVAPRSRATIWVDSTLPESQLSTVVTADVPVVVERAMYATGDRWWSAGHRAAGVPQPAASWFVSEGYSSPNFDTFVLLGNPNPTTAEVDVEFLGEGGTLLTRRYQVAPESRHTIWVNYEAPSLEYAPFSVRMRSANGVTFLAERAMWWSAVPDAPWVESHTSGSELQAGPRWAVTEAAAGGPGNAETYLLVANMGDQATTVTLTVYLDDGTSLSRAFGVAAGRRLTVNAGYEFPETKGHWFSVVAESASGTPIVVEKSLYWNVDGVYWAGGVSAPGTRVP